LKKKCDDFFFNKSTYFFHIIIYISSLASNRLGLQTSERRVELFWQYVVHYARALAYFHVQTAVFNASLDHAIRRSQVALFNQLRVLVTVLFFKNKQTSA
jgi:hypothetical protein